MKLSIAIPTESIMLKPCLACLLKFPNRWATQVTTYRKERSSPASSSRYLNWSTGRLLLLY